MSKHYSLTVSLESPRFRFSTARRSRRSSPTCSMRWGTQRKERFKGVRSERKHPGTFQEKQKNTKLGILGGATVSGSLGFDPLQSNPLKPFSQELRLLPHHVADAAEDERHRGRGLLPHARDGPGGHAAQRKQQYLNKHRNTCNTTNIIKTNEQKQQTQTTNRQATK